MSEPRETYRHVQLRSSDALGERADVPEGASREGIHHNHSFTEGRYLYLLVHLCIWGTHSHAQLRIIADLGKYLDNALILSKQSHHLDVVLKAAYEVSQQS